MANVHHTHLSANARPDSRLSFADATESVLDKSNKAVEKLRGVESEVQTVAVQYGEHDSTGIRKQNKEELESADAHETFSIVQSTSIEFCSQRSR